MNFLIHLITIGAIVLMALSLIYRSDLFSPFKQTFFLTTASERARIKQAIRYMLFLELAFFPFYILIWEPSIQYVLLGFLSLLSLGLFVGGVTPPVYVINGIDHLSLNISLSGSILCIHLRTTEQPFNLSTYRELGLVLNNAKDFQFDKIQMRSPLFCRQQSPRSFKMLEAFVDKHGYSISSRPLKWYESMPSKLWVFILKHCKRHPNPTIKKLDSCWYEITLHRLS